MAPARRHTPLRRRGSRSDMNSAHSGKQRNPGKWSSFSRRGERSQETCTSLAGVLKRMRVLIIDDDPNIIALASFALRGRGIEVIASTVASEGVRIAQSENVDAILLDLVMPELDG